MKREIIVIDEDLCNGCGEYVPSCHEGALHIIDEKARLIIDLFCDGLLQMAQMASQSAERKVPLKEIVISVQGDVMSENWM